MKRILLVVSLSFSFFNTCLAFDWIRLHTIADELSQAQALKAVDAHPASLEDKYVLGLVFLNLHNDVSAGKIFEQIIAVSPDNYEARWGLAEVLRRQHMIEKSKIMLEQIIKDEPRFSPAYISLAYIKYIQMDFKKSVQLADEVVSLGKENSDLSNYVRALLIMSGSKGMIAHYAGPISKLVNGTAVFPLLKKAQRLKPDDPAVLLGLGSFYLLAPNLAGGDIDKAVVFLEDAVKKDPLLADAYVRLAQAYKAKGEKDKYALYIDKAKEIDPENDLLKDITGGSCRHICVGRD